MFNPETGALISDDQPTTALLRGSAFTLLSGGAEGAESEFGVCAEKWGAQEETYSFAGRTTARTRGLIELNEQELARGAVSRTYLQAHMHRRYPDDPDFLKVLQSIWHQVNTAGQVFIVGQVLPDGTIKGGTGWAAELGRHLHKPVFVYDQEQGKWFQWRNEAWRPIEPPRIVARRFCGGGTRNLNETGKRAILNLFIRSFGEAK
ncbi:MAG: hypothetical protein H6707_19445 [Deltaproteobacteria bacterium]|nr:hypothetical protein [Deltaproteobacteria bacterium]